MNVTNRAARRAELPEICDLLEAAFDEAAPRFFAAQTEHDSTRASPSSMVASPRTSASSRGGCSCEACPP
jgi:hypothetical protein